MTQFKEGVQTPKTFPLVAPLEIVIMSRQPAEQMNLVADLPSHSI